MQSREDSSSDEDPENLMQTHRDCEEIKEALRLYALCMEHQIKLESLGCRKMSDALVADFDHRGYEEQQFEEAWENEEY